MHTKSSISLPLTNLPLLLITSKNTNRSHPTSHKMCYKGIFAELCCCFGDSGDRYPPPHHGGGQWHEVPPHPPYPQPLMNPHFPNPHQQQPQRQRAKPHPSIPTAGPWELLREEQKRAGIWIPQTADYAKGPRPDGTRTWRANWEGRMTAEFGEVGEGKGILHA